MKGFYGAKGSFWGYIVFCIVMAVVLAVVWVVEYGVLNVLHAQNGVGEKVIAVVNGGNTMTIKIPDALLKSNSSSIWHRVVEAVVIGVAILVATHLFNSRLEQTKIRLKHFQQLKNKEINLVHNHLKRISSINSVFQNATSVAESGCKKLLSRLSSLDESIAATREEVKLLGYEVEASRPFISEKSYDSFKAVVKLLNSYFDQLENGSFTELADGEIVKKFKYIESNINKQAQKVEF